MQIEKIFIWLKQSPRQWYNRFDYGSCVYIKFVDGSHINLLLYIDDMLIAAKSMEEITILKKLLSSEFDMKNLGAAKKILGMKITRDRNSGLLFLSQQNYIKKVFSISTCMMQNRLVLLLHLILNYQPYSVLVLMRILNICQGFHILVMLVL